MVESPCAALWCQAGGRLVSLVKVHTVGSGKRRRCQPAPGPGSPPSCRCLEAVGRCTRFRTQMTGPPDCDRVHTPAEAFDFSTTVDWELAAISPDGPHGNAGRGLFSTWNLADFHRPPIPRRTGFRARGPESDPRDARHDPTETVEPKPIDSGSGHWPRGAWVLIIEAVRSPFGRSRSGPGCGPCPPQRCQAQSHGCSVRSPA
jgi:hypothetical protein